MTENDIANRIHLLRMERGLTLQQVADAVGAKGASAVSNWEGGHGLSDRFAYKLAKFFGIPYAELNPKRFEIIASTEAEEEA
jgi:transcriptional regulator with XRE-family HTH domain